MLYPLKTAENLKCFLWFSGDIKGEPLPEMSKVAATNKILITKTAVSKF